MKETKQCEHMQQEEISRDYDDDGIYIRYKCLVCEDEITEYYELINRYNNTKGVEEPIPAKETKSLQEWNGDCPKCGNCNHEEIDYQHDQQESIFWMQCCDCGKEFKTRTVTILDEPEDKSITVSCPKCGDILFKGSQKEVKQQIVYCIKCNP